MNKWTRRGLLTTGLVVGGGLAVGIAIRPGNRLPELAKLVADDNETLLNTWVKLGADNAVTVIVPHSEMGQGVGTALAQMLADELDADWNQVRFEEAILPIWWYFVHSPMVHYQTFLTYCEAH